VLPIGWIHDLEVSPNRPELAISPTIPRSSRDVAVWLWNLGTSSRQIFTMPGSPELPTRLAYSSDGDRLAAVNQSEVRVWDLRDPKRTPLVLQSGQPKPLVSVAFSPSGTFLAAGEQDTFLWNLLKPLEAPVVLQGVPPLALDIAFSPDETRLAIASSTIRLWDLRSLKAPLVELVTTQWARSVTFSPDGSRLAAGGTDGSVHLFELGASAADYLCGRVWRNLSMDEWRLYLGDDIPYERTCPALPPGVGAPGAQ